MARTSTAPTPGQVTKIGGLAVATAGLHRWLNDSCEAGRILTRRTGVDGRRCLAIESERARAAELAARCREDVERWIEATTAGVLDASPPA